jgi:hypothetical protein
VLVQELHNVGLAQVELEALDSNLKFFRRKAPLDLRSMEPCCNAVRRSVNVCPSPVHAK